MTTPFLGQITLFPYNFAPSGWADCAGQLLPISQYTALFSLLGISYGGNGRTNFALPDLQGRIPFCQGQAPGLSQYVIGETGGTETVTLLPSNTPAHSHSLNATTAKGTTNAPSGQLLSTVQEGGLSGSAKGFIYSTSAPNTALAPQSIGPTGSGQPHNNLQPYLVLRYCIALQGEFPTRS